MSTPIRDAESAESRRLEAEQRWAEIEAAYERIRRDDPDGWRDYLGELAEVSAGESDATAAEKWPTGAAGSGGQR